MITRRRKILWISGFVLLAVFVTIFFIFASGLTTFDFIEERIPIEISVDEERGDYVSLIDNLRAKGATVNPEGEIEQPFFSVTGFSIQVNGSGVQIFEYNSAEDAVADASLVSADGSTIGTSMPFWVGDPHFYYIERIIVLYVGDNPAIEELLESVLGTQFAGR